MQRLFQESRQDAKVRRKSVCDFQPILIGLMLVVAAEGAGFDQVGEWLGASWSGTRAIPDLSVQLLD